MLKDWSPPSGWLRLTSIESHAAGEPFRVIISGYPALKGKNIIEKRTFASSHLDHLRKALIWEPRGHADMYGCLLTEPDSSEGDLGVLFIHSATPRTSVSGLSPKNLRI